MATQSSDEYLKEYIDGKDYHDSKENKIVERVENLGSHKDLDFIALDISELPCSYFYPAGTTVFVRPAKVSEIQAFSIVDDANFYDIFEKVNHMVSSCVFIKRPDGTKIPFTNLIDGDRWYLLFVIRELTFQKGSELYIEEKNVKIPIKRGHFTFHEMDTTIEKYYDELSGTFLFETKDYGIITMSPPTLGVQKSFSDYMVKRVQSKKDLDQSFLKIVPYVLSGRTSITEEGIEKELTKFKSMENDLFQFLNQAVTKMSFGISGVKTLDENGQEVRSENIFPDGISGLFVQSSAFENILI